jgi:hypothetical protein
VGLEYCAEQWYVCRSLSWEALKAREEVERDWERGGDEREKDGRSRGGGGQV